MSIATAILALSPQLYWECQDTTGPSAVDSSGHANAGFFYGNYALQQPGPENGTLSVLFLNGGGLRTPAQSPVITRPYSMCAFVTPQLFLPTNGGVVYNGNGGVDGSGLIWAAPSAVSQPVNLLHGGQGQSAALGALAPNVWHMVAVSESAGGNTIVWIDNGQVYNTAGNAPIAPGTSSPFQANSSLQSGASFYAHIALFPTVLSNANVNSIYTAGVLQTPGSILPVAPGNIATIVADLTAILAAVRHTFPAT